MSSPILNGHVARVDDTSLVLSADDRQMLERIATELESASLSAERRFELMQAIDDVAAKYAIDDPNVD